LLQSKKEKDISEKAKEGKAEGKDTWTFLLLVEERRSFTFRINLSSTQSQYLPIFP